MSKSLVKSAATNLVAQLKAMGVKLLPDNKTHRHRMEIRSETSNRKYIVAQRVTKGTESMRWECKCPGWINHRHCKHLDAMKPMCDALGASDTTIWLGQPPKQLEDKSKKKQATKLVKSNGSGVTPEPKDLQRMEDIVTKSNGDVGKMIALCEQMAKSIKDSAKAQRRAMAAKEILPKSVAKQAYEIFWQD